MDAKRFFISFYFLSLVPLIGCSSYHHAQEYELVPFDPFLYKADPEEEACISYLESIQPNIVEGRLKEIQDVRDSDVISAVVFSGHAIKDLVISYHAAQESWQERNAMPQFEFFFKFLERQPNLYDCLDYVSGSGVRVYYRRTNEGWHIFLLDRLSEEKTIDFLPLKVKLLPQVHTRGRFDS